MNTVNDTSDQTSLLGRVTAALDSARRQPPEVPGREPVVLPFVLSAGSDSALREQAAGLDAFWADKTTAEAACKAVARSMATAHPPQEHRAVILAACHRAAVTGLRSVAEGTPETGVATGRIQGGRTAFLFTGQGSQRPGMGSELYEAFPRFAEALDEVCAAIDPLLPEGRGLKDVMFGDAAGVLDRTEFTQPAVFAIEVALFRLMEAWGVRPDVVAGHSIGEISAAHVSGILSLADASSLVVARGRLMQALPDGGVMVAVMASEEEVRPLLAGHEAVAGVAAVNGPRSVVLSGAAEAVAEIVAALKEAGIKARALKVSHAFHSPLMDPMLAEFRLLAEKLTYKQGTIPVVSTVTGETADLADPEYWVRHVPGTVRFHDAIRTLEAEGVTTFVELGPDAICTSMAKSFAGKDAVFLPLMRRAQAETKTSVAALAEVFVRGGGVDWDRYFAGIDAPAIDLPAPLG